MWAPFCQLAAVAFLAAEGAAGSFAVRMPLVAVVAVAAPAGQVLQHGPGDAPVAAPAGGVAAGFGAQQPAQPDPVGQGPRSLRRLAVIAPPEGTLAVAAA